ncbi:unnamed protein product [Thelazia callipaeda]|uniref:RRM domain-containing protein n=1 Tax=Thelazia callipaeda TaxID=103827 RepID=A0A0N5D551_THECL|nr:unnamed protein product [Thelazia callipaeda]
MDCLDFTNSSEELGVICYLKNMLIGNCFFVYETTPLIVRKKLYNLGLKSLRDLKLKKGNYVLLAILGTTLTRHNLDGSLSSQRDFDAKSLRDWHFRYSMDRPRGSCGVSSVYECSQMVIELMVDSDRRTCYVSNLHADVTEELLKELFCQVGPFEAVILRKSKCYYNGSENRYALIVFKHETSVPFACAMLDRVKLFGVRISVRPKQRGHQTRQRTKAFLSTHTPSSMLNNPNNRLSTISKFENDTHEKFNSFVQMYSSMETHLSSFREILIVDYDDFACLFLCNSCETVLSP